MATTLVTAILTAALMVLPARAAQWPGWTLPAPLPRPGHSDLVYPAWFAGPWRVTSAAITPATPDAPQAGEEPGATLHYDARFTPRQGASGPAAVGERAFNATGIGRALLGERLLSVDDDPANPNRQIARLAGDLQLESSVVGRRSETVAAEFWTDELALQVLHGPGEPRVSRVETLSRYRLEADGTISGEQWQASYPSPARGLAARPLSTGHYRLRLSRQGLTAASTPVTPASDPPAPQADPAS